MAEYCVGVRFTSLWGKAILVIQRTTLDCVRLTFLWPPYVIGGHYIFCPVGFFLSSIYLLFFSPNLSRRRLDVYHTLTHGVALVRI